MVVSDDGQQYRVSLTEIEDPLPVDFSAFSVCAFNMQRNCEMVQLI
jgi:hypothetical protein